MKLGRRRTYFKSIESIAMTDIVFLLLIFFMLTSNFVDQTGIQVDIPEMKKPPVTAVRDQISVAVNAKHQVFLNNNLINKEDLTSKIELLVQDNPETVVVFRPDKSIRVEDLVDVMDRASLAGAKKLIIATRVDEQQE